MNKLKHANGNKVLSLLDQQNMIREAAEHYGRYLTALGFDWAEDPNSSETPIRVAKAFVNDLASGVYNESPKITAFDNALPCRLPSLLPSVNLDKNCCKS